MNRRAGFTLLEILVVVMIITILATIVGVSVSRRPGETRMMAAKVQIEAFRTALDLYRMDQGMFPSQEQGLKALCEKPTISPIPDKYPDEPYLRSRKVPLDPWKHDYVYLVPGSKGEKYEIISYGADGEQGGEGEKADISSEDL